MKGRYARLPYGRELVRLFGPPLILLCLLAGAWLLLERLPNGPSSLASAARFALYEAPFIVTGIAVFAALLIRVWIFLHQGRDRTGGRS